ncbi:SIR2 family protein [Hymenobacter pini]|uniref:SIR2 family protein n=1 Tax=Hymenobacter pini TaxID=2880879 RepID=UPI001CF188F3|nr:SIR2 family protein [Hymenobacter pini]MCA8830152.1 SIR2 family protein [Hymenobacter pini]
MIIDQESFIKKYVEHIEEGDAALFIGAGMSVSQGFVDWRSLLREIADDLKLEINKEYDLLSVAQFHFNKFGRNSINKKIIDEYSKKAVESKNHQIIARIPIDTIWTTNYDKLIEKSIEKADKRADVKTTVSSLANNKKGRDVTVFKMHGDVDRPEEAVLIKDDYQSYHIRRQEFTNTLVSHFITKTFLFLGFSFTDPNIDYILSRVKLEIDKNARPHYCIIRKVKQEGEYKKKADFEYAIRKQELLIEDLRRFNIHTVLISEYSDITNILLEVERRYKQKTIYISGSAVRFNTYSQDEATNFIHNLSHSLIEKGYNIVTGFGWGVGSAVINGALQAIYSDSQKYSDKQLTIRPFPQLVIGELDKDTLWHEYRERMLNLAGIAIFLFGNKEKGDEIINSDGVRKEFEIAKKQNILLLPVGATGYMSFELWEEVYNNLKYYFPSRSKVFNTLFTSLSNNTIPLSSHLETIHKILSLIKKP